jgi:hypothetical protein
VKNSLERCEAMRFGGSLQSAEKLRDEAGPVLERLIQALQKTKRGAIG